MKCILPRFNYPYTPIINQLGVKKGLVFPHSICQGFIDVAKSHRKATCMACCALSSSCNFCVIHLARSTFSTGIRLPEVLQDPPSFVLLPINVTQHSWPAFAGVPLKKTMLLLTCRLRLLSPASASSSPAINYARSRVPNDMPTKMIMITASGVFRAGAWSDKSVVTDERRRSRNHLFCCLVGNSENNCTPRCNYLRKTSRGKCWLPPWTFSFVAFLNLKFFVGVRKTFHTIL